MSALLFKTIALLAPGAVRVEDQTVLWPFLQIGNFLENAFMLVPYWGIKAIITVLFLSLAVIPFFFSKKYIFEGAEDQSAWRDLRYWALAAALTEIVVYLYF
jgi:hypothetical protein